MIATTSASGRRGAAVGASTRPASGRPASGRPGSGGALSGSGSVASDSGSRLAGPGPRGSVRFTTRRHLSAVQNAEHALQRMSSQVGQVRQLVRRPRRTAFSSDKKGDQRVAAPGGICSPDRRGAAAHRRAVALRENRRSRLAPALAAFGHVPASARRAGSPTIWLHRGDRRGVESTERSIAGYVDAAASPCAGARRAGATARPRNR